MTKHWLCVLAMSASPRGFAFVLFVGRESPFDWGVKTIYGQDRNRRCLIELEKLVRKYNPATIVIEDTGPGSRRGPRIRALCDTIHEVYLREEREVTRFTRADVRAAFAADGARTRPEIAKAIAARIPAFMHRLPPLRKIWMSEDPRQSLFDAAALGVTYYGAGGIV